MLTVAYRFLCVVRLIESLVGDWWMNIRTSGAVHLGPKRGLGQDADDYQTSLHVAIKKVIRLVRPGEKDVVFDVGCGKGRVICHFAQQPVRKVVGIEISEHLCDIARLNVSKLRNKRAPVEIINGDAAVTDLSSGTIYYMNNPFGATTLRAVLKNIERSHKQVTNGVTIIYMNAQFAAVFDEFPWLEIVADYRRFCRQRVTIYRDTAMRKQVVVKSHELADQE